MNVRVYNAHNQRMRVQIYATRSQTVLYLIHKWPQSCTPWGHSHVLLFKSAQLGPYSRSWNNQTTLLLAHDNENSKPTATHLFYMWLINLHPSCNHWRPSHVLVFKFAQFGPYARSSEQPDHVALAHDNKDTNKNGDTMFLYFTRQPAPVM